MLRKSRNSSTAQPPAFNRPNTAGQLYQPSRLPYSQPYWDWGDFMTTVTNWERSGADWGLVVQYYIVYGSHMQ